LNGRPLDALAGELRCEFDRAATLWRTQRETILAMLRDGESWAKGDHNKSDVHAEQVRFADRCFAEEGPTPESLAALKHFSATSLEENTRKNGTNPTHPFFTQCDVVNECRANFIIALHLAFLDFAKAELPRRKQHRKIQTFDDLLTRLHAALHGPGGDALSLQLRQRYRAALIDEFQDTDPVQYQNFHRIFATAESRTSALLFLIGDPKQAIYGFRGADIFTYLDAARAADRRFTLDQNWRSESGLIHAVNTIFARSPSPFLFEAIPFRPVLAAGKADLTPLTEKNSPTPQLHVWLVPREPDAKTIATAFGEKELPRNCRRRNRPAAEQRHQDRRSTVDAARHRGARSKEETSPLDAGHAARTPRARRAPHRRERL
jgi:exodeoxyribonuclease V beta subunit